jgi:FkbM family methyltransferase
MLYKIISVVARLLFKDRIKDKKFYNSKKYLYYNISEHLGFLFQKEIKYELDIFNIVKEYLSESRIVFDIGANIGQYAIPISEIIGSEGKIYSFEPDPKNFAFLQFNASINHCDNLTCFNHGVGDEDKELVFYRDTITGGRMGSFIKNNVGDNFQGFETIQKIKKLDTLITIYGEPDFIKIDVEGYEYEVLLGLSSDLKNTIWLVEVRQSTKEAVFNYFDNRGYECRHIENSNILINNPVKIPGFANLLFKKP